MKKKSFSLDGCPNSRRVRGLAAAFLLLLRFGCIRILSKYPEPQKGARRSKGADLHCARSYPGITPAKYRDNFLFLRTTRGSGSLGSWVDEDRCKMRN